MWKLSSKNKIAAENEKKILVSYQAFMGRLDVGFKDLNQWQGLAEETQKLAQPEEHIVIFGIGGSSMGTQAIVQAIFPQDWREKITFFDNVDAVTFEQKLDKIKNPQKTRWIIISKSGKTIETLACFDFCQQFFIARHSYDICQRTTVITEEGESPLQQFAKSKNLEILPVPANVGGRFSVFTPVGLYPLACMGVSLEQIKAGMERALANEELVCEITGILFESLQREEYSFYPFYYTDRLVHWGEWLQQLWSESLAKAVNIESQPGPLLNTIVPCRGATYQHSVLQQVVEGREKKFVCFLRLGDSERGSLTLNKSFLQNDLMEGKTLGELLAAEAQATEQALNERGIATMLLQSEKLNIESISELMMTWMLVVGTLGELLHIDAYVQPGVESGKRLARQFLSPSR